MYFWKRTCGSDGFDSVVDRFVRGGGGDLMSATERPAARVGMSWDRKAGPGLVQKVGIAGRTVLVGVVINF